ncbi:MAG: hypothetical protein UV82_C0018G0010, partial [Candidatus Magasanikbacteria bacterium GW2011_GWD2_43_18]
MFRKRFFSYLTIISLVCSGVVFDSTVVDATKVISSDFSIRLGSIDYDTPTYTYVDSSGKMYVTGAIKGNADLSGDGDYLDGGESSIGYGNYDGFISVFDASGGYLWSKRLGGVSNDQGLSVVTDASGNVIVTGIVLGNADLSGNGDYLDGGESSVGYGNYDAFITNFNASGEYLWSERLGSTDVDYPYSVTVDATSDNIIIAGTVGGYDADLSGDGDYLDGGEDVSVYTSSDMFISVFSSSTYVWSKRLPDLGNQNGRIVITDSQSNIIVGGDASWDVDFNQDGDVLDDGESGSANVDYFVLSLDSTGNFNWVSRVGGSGACLAESVYVDSSDNVYVTGYVTGSVDFNQDTFLTEDGEDATGYGLKDVFLLSFDINGAYRWSNRLGGSSNDSGYSVTTDSNNNVIVSGYVNGDADLRGDLSITSGYGSNDAFISMFDQSGSFLGKKRFGSSLSDNGKTVFVDPNDNIIVYGKVGGDTDFNQDGDVVDGGESSLNYGLDDLFVAVFTVTNNVAPTLTSFSATQSSDGTGEVSIVSTVDDADDNELSIAYYYEEIDTCGASLPSTTSTISTVSSLNGTAVTSTGSYQVTTVTTTPGANIVTSTWTSAIDVSGANGETYCVYAVVNDGNEDASMTTTTVTLDNTAPSAPSITGFTIASTTLTPAWST